MDKRREDMIKVINESAWDGEWYLAAINDLGNPVGSKNEKEGKIYLNSQTWAILSGVASGERAEHCFRAIDEHLDSPYGPLVLTPAYKTYNPNIGRLTGFVPGIWENGTPYCHSGAFKAVADCIGGRGDKAYETLMKIIPNSDINPSIHSGCEPYALTNMYLGPENPRAGETLFAWVTGTAGWIFRLVTTYILGFHTGYNDVEIKPCLPSGWRNCSYTRYWRGGTYHVSITNPESSGCKVKEIKVDGKIIEGNKIPMFTCGEHKIDVVLV
jgi:cellobiose phosphorylase